MDLSKILSISGRGGLFKVVSQLKNAVVVESLTDQKRFPAFSNERMSTLEEISLYTTGEDRPLKEILKAFYEKLEGKPAADPKSSDADLMKAFGEIVPDYDPDRVYTSDIRKIFVWYNQLLAANLLDFSEEEKKEETEPTAEGEPSEDQIEKSKPKKKPSTPKKTE